MNKDRRLGRGSGRPVGDGQRRSDGGSGHHDSHPGEASRPSPGPRGESPSGDQQGGQNGIVLVECLRDRRQPFSAAPRLWRGGNCFAGREPRKITTCLQPLLVRCVSGRYQLISGERRLRAAIKAGWEMVPARVREADDRLVAELAIVENLQRKDLNPIEKATVLQTVPGSAPLYPGGVGTATQDRSLDNRQPDAVAGAARCGRGLGSREVI